MPMVKKQMNIFNCFSAYHVYQSILMIDSESPSIFIINYKTKFSSENFKNFNIRIIYKDGKCFNKFFYKIINYFLLLVFNFIFSIFRSKKQINFFSSPHHSSFLATYFRSKATRSVLFNEGFYSKLEFINGKPNPLYKSDFFSRYFLFNYFNFKVKEFIVDKNFVCKSITLDKNKIIHLFKKDNFEIYNIYFNLFFDINGLPKVKNNNNLLILLSSDRFRGITDDDLFLKNIKNLIRKNINKYSHVFIKAHPFDNYNYSFDLTLNKKITILPNQIPFEAFEDSYKFKKIISFSLSL